MDNTNNQPSKKRIEFHSSNGKADMDAATVRRCSRELADALEHLTGALSDDSELIDACRTLGLGLRFSGGVIMRSEAKHGDDGNTTAGKAQYVVMIATGEACEAVTELGRRLLIDQTRRKTIGAVEDITHGESAERLRGFIAALRAAAQDQEPAQKPTGDESAKFFDALGTDAAKPQDGAA